MGFLPKMFFNANKVKVRKIAGGALVLQSAGSVFYIKPLNYSKIALTSLESGESALSGTGIHGELVELARFQNEAQALSALNKIYAASTSSWKTTVKRVIYIGIALVVIDSMLGTYQEAKVAALGAPQLSQSALQSAQQVDQTSAYAGQNQGTRSDSQDVSQTSPLNCAPQ